MFGRESCGLETEEVNACTYQCEIPVPGLMSLNLAQAVTVGLYELCRSGALANGEGRAKRGTKGACETAPATIDQIDSFKKFLDRYLTGQYHDQSWRDNFLNTLLQRLHPTRNELSALFGLIRNLAKEDLLRELVPQGCQQREAPGWLHVAGLRRQQPRARLDLRPLQRCR